MSRQSRTYTSGEICDRFGIAKNTLFSWEKNGKIPKAERDWRNHRHYTANHVRALQALIEGEFTQVRNRFRQLMRDEENPHAIEEAKRCLQLASVRKFTKQRNELGLQELNEWKELDHDAIRELLQHAQKEDPGSHWFYRIIDLIHSKIELAGVSSSR